MKDNNEEIVDSLFPYKEPTQLNGTDYYRLPINKIEHILSTKDQEIQKVVEGLRKGVKKSKHVGKSWCPDCEDTGYDYALDDVLKALTK